MDLIEIRIHGRGGLGSKTAGQLIAEAALTEKKWVQAFSEFGPERSGAPVQTYVKISDKPILSYSPIKHAEIVMVIDDSLIDEKMLENISSTCIFVINTKKDIRPLLKKYGFNGHIYCIDATKIALEILGKNLPNIALIGALIKATDEKIIKLDSLNKKIYQVLEEKGEKVIKQNIEAIKRCYNEVKRY